MIAKAAEAAVAFSVSFQAACLVIMPHRSVDDGNNDAQREYRWEDIERYLFLHQNPGIFPEGGVITESGGEHYQKGGCVDGLPKEWSAI